MSATAFQDSLEAAFEALTQSIMTHGPDHAGDMLDALEETFPALRG